MRSKWEVVKAGASMGSTEVVSAESCRVNDGALVFVSIDDDFDDDVVRAFAPGTWTDVTRIATEADE